MLYCSDMILRRFKRQKREIGSPEQDILDVRQAAFESFAVLRRDYTAPEQVAFEDEVARLARAAANLGLVRGAIDALPEPSHINSYGYHGGAFYAGDVQKAKLILGNVLWWRGTQPNFLVGEKPGDKPKWRDIMLMPSDPKAPPVVATVKNDRLKELKENGVHNTLHPLPSENFLDKATRQLVVTGNSLGALVLEGEIRMSIGERMNGTPSSTPIQHGISEGMMAEFDVDSHLQYLAVEFNTTAALRRAYREAGRDINHLLLY